MKKFKVYSKKKQWLGNRSGQGLVSVLIAAAVGVVILGFLADMMADQGRGQKFLTQKIEINDLTNNLITTFSKANICTCQFADSAATNPNFANFTNLKFNSTIIDGSQRIDIKKVFTGCLGGPNPPLVIAEEGLTLPNTTTGIKVAKIELVNLRPTGPPNEWQGQWQISFQLGGGSVVRSVKPISVSQNVIINTAAPYSAVAAMISGCGGVSTGSGTVNFLTSGNLR